MKLIKVIVFVLVIVSLSSCEDLLDPDLDGTLSEEAVWSNNNLAFGFLNNAYNNLPDGYNRISNAMLAAATDDAVSPDPISKVNGFNDGRWSPFNVIDDVWNKNYEGIRKVNTFLEKVDSVPLPKKSNALGTDESILNTRKRMKGEARFLRAYFYLELVKRYRGVPLTQSVLTPEEAVNLKRASSDECFEFILAECEAAAQLLPRKYGSAPAIVGFNEGKDIGRATSGAALALKSRALLYWASPLFNPANDITRWERAATAAAEVIDYTVNENGGTKVYNLQRFSSTLTMSTLFTTNSIVPQYHDELIFSTKYNNNTTVERQNAPISYGAKGLTNPTQNLVEAFPMSNGKAISDPTSGYDSNNPFKDRDPRLSMTVLANGTEFEVNDKARVLETFDGGADGPGAYPNATQTGYYLQKYVMPFAAWEGRTVDVTRTWILIRFAEIYLNLAEARNEAFGPDDDVYFALRTLRFRAGFRPVYVPPGLSKDEMRKFIQNERRIEMAFEEHRFFDVRRWKLFDQPSEREKLLTIRGVKITKDPVSGNFTYDTNNVVQQRFFSDKMYLYPISESELNRSNMLEQNPGW
ncbi:RagB/SusD family nutrient uptake outer membrane protein [Gelidibacter maritimus]|uniref:RagB/SusD family nutrient uptake outer membrane protein n=1 Tax=Gelidibacter maritimus TaxID=2761487 RepID=A0A7W2R5C6_9FLAO|nr:RagB/SusD family nutrient uptake outer membrane protein [Gelidibacter maritimus]MBA6154633.1 RagB/SusD family nutrient uptake outer membrane protein [Gelidibacter maritimus]